MFRKVVERDPRTGATRETYKDLGPSCAVPGHGRPLMTSATALGGGGMQRKDLPQASRGSSS